MGKIFNIIQKVIILEVYLEEVAFSMKHFCSNSNHPQQMSNQKQRKTKEEMRGSKKILQITAITAIVLGSNGIVKVSESWF